MIIDHRINNGYNRFTSLAIVIVVLLAISGASWFGYSWYRKSQEYKAHQAFTESVEEFNKGQAWDEVAQSFKEAAKRYSSSSLYPFFLVYQSEALKKQNNLDQALEVMKSALDALGKKSLLYGLYAVKYAIMQINAQDTNIQQQGLELLKELSKDKSSDIQEMALYYLGYNAYMQNNQNEAQEYWNEMNKKSDQYSIYKEFAKNYIPTLGE